MIDTKDIRLEAMQTLKADKILSIEKKTNSKIVTNLLKD
jgi:hypothetical protein